MTIPLDLHDIKKFIQSFNQKQAKHVIPTSFCITHVDTDVAT